MPAVNRATKQLTSCVWFRTTSVWIVTNLKGCALFKVCHQHEKTALFKERGSVAVTFRKWKLEKGTPRQVTRQWALNAVLFTIFFSPTFLQPFDNNLTSRPHNTYSSYRIESPCLLIPSQKCGCRSLIFRSLTKLEISTNSVALSTE